MGNETFIYFELDGVQFILRMRTQANLTLGLKIKIYLESDKIYFFDKETGKTLV